MTSGGLLFHPDRRRVVQALLGERVLTTSQIAGELEDVPLGSLYRHVARLAGAGVLRVVSERRVRGAVEHTCFLRAEAALGDPAALAAMTPDELREAFMVFLAGLLAEADRYLAAGPPDRVRARAGFRMGALWLPMRS